MTWGRSLKLESTLSFVHGWCAKGDSQTSQEGLAVAKAFLNGIGDGLVGLAKIGFDAVIKFLNGIAEVIRQNDDN